VTPREHVEQLAADGEEILLADGFEDALMGIQQTFEHGGIRYRTLYSLKRCVEIMMADGSTYESALEYLNFNTLGAYVGRGTPSFFLDLDLEDAP
jgi:hypothetical protein